MKYEVKVPAVGESITEATIGSWVKKNGQAVKRNDVLMLLETDKASVEVVAEQDGVLTVTAQEGSTIPIGSVVAFIDSDGKASSIAAAPTPTAPAATAIIPTAANGKPLAPPVAEGNIHADLKNHLSPAVQKMVTEKNLDPQQIQGTGRDGRLTKSDVMTASAGGGMMAQTSAAPKSAPQAPVAAKPVAITNKNSKQGDITRMPMTTIRKKIAEKLVQSQQTTATLTTFNEVDMTKIIEIRAKYKDKFKEKYGVNLGFMGFFVKASIEALRAWPAVNSTIDGTDLLYKNFYNIGVAVGTDKGLIVPVIKDADTMSIAQVELAIRDFAAKARDGKISFDDLSGGTFTISNGGVYGSLMSTPILNPPQSGILGMHKMQERPIVIDGKIEVRTMMYLALSYDHRVIDGKEAVSFLVKIKEGIEDPERLLIEV